ncbi:hypothetical protein [Yoonia sediminilitoris]|uniref:HEAT repeat protein n=1 Tax=Yoonia sediminilitoris TaxID=1286148 RepID=A0A2T6KBY5_9RHOB|nr:hypothetical protein [Yoonia sediminilitoris]PUB12417.1 hypothetical protein C8N45_11056 [Yoonia sediminilitoris]RCW93111.1 hypothetical protein DFP92_11056 [Yoonia sediminilitoris]
MTQTLASKLDKALPALRSETVAAPDARRIVQEAGVSGDEALRPQLRALAGSIRADTNRSVIYDALHGLWRLGEDPAFFLESAENHAANKWLAYYSILMLGRDPSDAHVAARLDEIAAQTTDNQIRGAIAQYGRSRYLRQRYARFTKLTSKVDFILNHFQGYWNPVLFEAGTDLSSDMPEAAWLEQELRALSQDAPEEVARLIHEADMSDLCPDPEMKSAWCTHMASLLAPEAGAALRARVATEDGGDDV